MSIKLSQPASIPLDVEISTPHKSVSSFLSSGDSGQGDEALALFKALDVTLNEAEDTVQAIDEKRLRRRLDLRILPLLAGISFLQYLDKNLLASAAIMGLRQDCHLVGQQYTQVSFAFYIGMLIWVIPSVFLAQKSGRVAKYMSCNVILAGIALCSTASVSSYSSLFGVRLVLGMAEACDSACLILIIAAFYKKNEQAKRVSAFFMMIGFAIIVGQLSAYGFSHLTTTFAGWRAMYLLFGGITIIWGFLCLLFLPDSPSRARFLTYQERLKAVVRVKGNQSGTANSTFKLYQIWEVVRDPRVWLVWALILSTTVPNGGVTNYAGIISVGLGISAQNSLALGSIAGVVAIIATLATGFAGDRYNSRSLIILIAIIPALIGSALLVANANKASALAGIYIIATFGSSFAAILSYNTSNVAGATKRSFVYSMSLIFYSVGNILGTEAFQARDAPDYLPGKIAILVCFGVAIFLVGVLRMTLYYSNKSKRLRLEMMTEEERSEGEARMAFADETDIRNPFFMYTN